MRLVPVPALHMRVEMGEAEPQTFTQVLVKQTVLGTYQDKSNVSTQQVVSERASGDGEDGDADQSSGPLVMEVDGLRPGPSVIQVITGNSKEPRPSLRVSKSVPVDPTDGQTLDVRGIASAGVVSGMVRVEGNASPPPGVLVFLRNATSGSPFQAGRRLGREFQFFFRWDRAGSVRSVFRGVGRAGASEREREWDKSGWAKDRD